MQYASVNLCLQTATTVASQTRIPSLRAIRVAQPRVYVHTSEPRKELNMMTPNDFHFFIFCCCKSQLPPPPQPTPSTPRYARGRQVQATRTVPGFQSTHLPIPEVRHLASFVLFRPQNFGGDGERVDQVCAALHPHCGAVEIHQQPYRVPCARKDGRTGGRRRTGEVVTDLDQTVSVFTLGVIVCTRGKREVLTLRRRRLRTIAADRGKHERLTICAG